MILLTGASGVVGTAVLREAEEQAGGDNPGNSKIVALCHKRPVRRAVESVHGDVSQPRLGLDNATYSGLCRDIDMVVHSAAVVGFGHRAERYRAINEGGTRNIVQFVKDAGASLIQVSTAFVSEGLSSIAAPSGYEASKRASEELIRHADIPATIVRPSIVVGDSRTGEISADQGLHQVIGGWMQGRIRVVPGSDQTLLDFVSQDYLARVILALCQETEVARRNGEDVWVTSGPDALRIREAADAINAFMVEKGVGGDPLRVIPFDRIERLFVPVFLPALPKRQQAEFHMLMRLARYMNIESPLPCSRRLITERLGVAFPPPALTVLRRNLDAWWERTGHLSLSGVAI